jgi:hypothetical protein
MTILRPTASSVIVIHLEDDVIIRVTLELDAALL